MKQQELERQLEQKLRQTSTTALNAGIPVARLLQSIDRYGGLAAVKKLIRRGATSDGFDALRAAGRLDLSVEAIVTCPKYASLFTDEEVDHCLALLCESGYYHT